jgi:hypothetical protein
MLKVMEPSRLFEQVVGVVLTFMISTTCAERDSMEKTPINIISREYLIFFIDTRFVDTRNTAKNPTWLQVPLEQIAQIAIKIGVLKQ